MSDNRGLTKQVMQQLHSDVRTTGINIIEVHLLHGQRYHPGRRVMVLSENEAAASSKQHVEHLKKKHEHP